MRCDYCHRAEISLFWSGLWTKYCSFSCACRHGRYFSLGLTLISFPLIFIQPIFVLAFIGFGLFTYYGFIHNPRIRRSLNEKNEKVPLSTDDEGIPTQFTPDPSNIPMKYVDDLGREYDICCYQSARLADKYCSICGKAVDSELINYLNT